MVIGGNVQGIQQIDDSLDQIVNQSQQAHPQQWTLQGISTNNQMLWNHKWKSPIKHLQIKHHQKSNHNVQGSLPSNSLRSWQHSPHALMGQIVTTSWKHFEHVKCNEHSTYNLHLHIHEWTTWLQQNASCIHGMCRPITQQTRNAKIVECTCKQRFLPQNIQGALQVLKIWVKETRSMCIADTVYFKHKYITMLAVSKANTTVSAARHLAQALQDELKPNIGERTLYI